MSQATRLIGFCVLLSVCESAVAGKHYTARLSDEGATTRPKVQGIVFSSDGSKLIVGTSGGTHFVKSKGAQIVGKLNFTPFSMAWSRDESRTFLIGAAGRTLMDMHTGTELEIGAARVDGYIGLGWNRTNGKLLITALGPGGPCDQNGKIHVGDELVSVGTGNSGRMQSLVGVSAEKAMSYIKGSAGTWVRLGIIPDGEINESMHLLRRQAKKQVDGKSVFIPFEVAAIDDNVAWSLSEGSHEFSSARTGRVVSTLQTNNIPNEVGFPAVSPDTKLFAFVGQYIDPPKIARPPAEPKKKKRRAGGIGRSVINSVADAIESGDTPHGIFGVEIFDIASQKLVATFPLDSEPVNTLVAVPAFFGTRFSPNGRHLITGTWSKIHVYDIATGKKINEFPAPPHGTGRRVEKLAVSDRLVAVGDLTGIVSLLNLETGQVVKEIETREEGEVAQVEFSADGKWLAFVVHDVLHVVDVSDAGNAE